MKAQNIIKQSFLIIGILAIGVTLGFGQGIFDKVKERVKNEANKVKDEANKVKDQVPSQTNPGGGTGTASGYKWARIETRASWDENGKKKYETRVYYSDVSSYQTGDARMVENLAQYFEDGVAAPLKTRGIEVKFYDSDITIFPASYSYETTAEAEKAKQDRMVNDKDAKYAIYSFVWKYNAKATGEAVTQPKRISNSDKQAPSFENTPVAENNNAAEREAKQNAASKENEMAQQQKLIWGYAILKVSVKDSRGKTVNRVYVSEIAPVSRDDYNAYYNTDERFIKPRIWEYFAATVAKAAKTRGEEIEEPYDSSIMYQFTLDRDVNGKPLFKGKSVLEEPRTREIGYAKDNSRTVLYFNWDPSGKNVQADLQKEMGRAK